MLTCIFAVHLRSWPLVLNYGVNVGVIAVMVVYKLREVKPARDKVYSAAQAAELLGITSVVTVRRWLEGGHFPGAYKTPEGFWVFPESAVREARRRIQDGRARDILAPLIDEDCGEPPLL